MECPSCHEECDEIYQCKKCDRMFCFHCREMNFIDAVTMGLDSKYCPGCGGKGVTITSEDESEIENIENKDEDNEDDSDDDSSYSSGGGGGGPDGLGIAIMVCVIGAVVGVVGAAFLYHMAVGYASNFSPSRADDLGTPNMLLAGAVIGGIAGLYFVLREEENRKLIIKQLLIVVIVILALLLIGVIRILSQGGFR